MQTNITQIIIPMLYDIMTMVLKSLTKHLFKMDTPSQKCFVSEEEKNLYVRAKTRVGNSKNKIRSQLIADHLHLLLKHPINTTLPKRHLGNPTNMMEMVV